MASCARCSGPISDPKRAWQEIKGFTRPRTDGGTNHVLGRHPTGRVICGSCATDIANGVNRNQDSLLPDPTKRGPF